MVFSSISFLFYFLPIVIISYYIAPKKSRNFILLVASLYFYFAGEQLMIWAMLFSSMLDYICSLLVERYRSHRIIPKISLLASVTVNLGLLGYFKYSDFFIKNVNGLFGASIPLLGIALPIGISFYTFQTMSYTIDVYMGNTNAQKNPLTFATYVTLFPQLIAGPIVRYTTVEEELRTRKHTIADFSYGIRRFIIGLAKKVLIANTLATLGKTILYSSERTVMFHWLYAIAFMLQVYFDFSGYSDMAIGLGRMFGFKFLENFNYPYTAVSVTDFWRRWHISLSTWFRDYIYIPLGGNRVSKVKWIRNVFIVWFLTGFWHGAEWNFIVWGVFFFFFLLLDKFALNKLFSQVPRIILRLVTLFTILIGFVLFNANNMTEAFFNLTGLFGFSPAGPLSFWGAESLYYLKSYLFLFIVAGVASTPLAASFVNKLKVKFSKAVNILEPIYLMFLLLWVTGCLVDGSFNPFLYFRF